MIILNGQLIKNLMINNFEEAGANDKNAVADDDTTSINVHGHTCMAIIHAVEMLDHGAFLR